MKSSAPFIRLQIADDSKDSLAREARRHGLSQTELASRLVEWLVKQQSVVQATVLNNIKNDMEDQLAEMLRSLAVSRGLAGDAADAPAPAAGRKPRDGKKRRAGAAK